ncbi:hypothetical protein AWZ03_008673 [Drosophila navojoa]|uniref:MADF domain-containing protein n=1 Tax=Drosophila navojoa TaxID=7232 RepID=A0A484BAS5_DRONA|nr:uncharacterized protein LOC115563333 [Drosophila navojoa]XP_030241948.1 uncharacterized protein LOC115563333 [Drosophila navojoa]TDG44865.1 hypothetical protein AWZ03_008673 [Drosophila navojoa]
MENNIKQPLVGDIDIGLVKIEHDEMPDINIVEKMELQWEQNQQKQQLRPKPFHRGQRMVNWREGEVNYLIDLVKNNSYVWNSSVPDFKKKHKKALFWELAADKINNALNPRTPFTRNDCFKKWNNLRTYFQAEVKSIKIKNNGGTSDGEEISGGWKYSSKMSFLIGTRLPQIAVNAINNNEHSVFDATTSLSDSNGESEMEVSNQEPQENDCKESIAIVDELHQSPPGSPQTKRRKNNDLPDGPENIIPQNMPNNVNKLPTNALASQFNKSEESRSYYYSKYVGQCLDKLDADLNLEAREKISEILFKYEKVQLKRS